MHSQYVCYCVCVCVLTLNVMVDTDVCMCTYTTCEVVYMYICVHFCVSNSLLVLHSQPLSLITSLSGSE